MVMGLRLCSRASEGNRNSKQSAAAKMLIFIFPRARETIRSSFVNNLFDEFFPLGAVFFIVFDGSTGVWIPTREAVILGRMAILKLLQYSLTLAEKKIYQQQGGMRMRRLVGQGHGATVGKNKFHRQPTDRRTFFHRNYRVVAKDMERSSDFAGSDEINQSGAAYCVDFDILILEFLDEGLAFDLQHRSNSLVCALAIGEPEFTFEIRVEQSIE